MSSAPKLILFVLAIAVNLTAANGFAAAPVSVCGESWPPYLYEKESENQADNEVAGIHLANFRALAELTGLEFTFALLPWKRCVHGVENYSRPGDPEVALDASFSAERAEKFYFVGPIYTWGTAVFYSRNRFPDGPFSQRFGRVITRIGDMQDFSICGLMGHNYDSYYTKYNIPRSVKIDQTPAGYPGVFKMLSNQRCDVVETHPQVVLGTMLIGKMEMPKDIACRKLISDPQNFYLMVSKKSPRAEELVAQLSTALIQLKYSGKWVSIADEGILPTSEFTDIKNCM